MREQLQRLERQNGELLQENKRLADELDASRMRERLLEEQRLRDQEHVVVLEERLNEVSNGHVTSGLSETLSSAVDSEDLKRKILQLETENNQLKIKQLEINNTNNTNSTNERIGELEAEQKKQMEMINSLLVEKSALQNELISTKDQILQKERQQA